MKTTNNNKKGIIIVLAVGLLLSARSQQTVSIVSISHTLTNKIVLFEIDGTTNHLYCMRGSLDLQGWSPSGSFNGVNDGSPVFYSWTLSQAQSQSTNLFFQSYDLTTGFP